MGAKASTGATVHPILRSDNDRIGQSRHCGKVPPQEENTHWAGILWALASASRWNARGLGRNCDDYGRIGMFQGVFCVCGSAVPGANDGEGDRFFGHVKLAFEYSVF